MPIISRRSFVAGLFAAPAVIAYAKLMPVKALAMPDTTLHRLRQEAMRGLVTDADYTEFILPNGHTFSYILGRNIAMSADAIVTRLFDITPEGHVIEKPLLPIA